MADNNEDDINRTPDGGAEIAVGTRMFDDPNQDDNLVTSISKVSESKFSSIYDEDKKLNGKELLKEMGQVVVEEYKIDLASRSQWETNTSEVLKMFSNFMEPKNFPWENASNVNVPFLAIACLQFQARAYPEIIPAKEVVKVFDPGSDDPEKAKRVSDYMNYQLLYEMPEFEAQFDKSLMQLPLEGGMFKKTYRDFVNKRNVSEYIPALDLVINYGAKSLESAARLTHQFHLTKNDIRKRVRQGIFIQDAWDLKTGNAQDSQNKRDIQEASDEIEGVTDVGENTATPRRILEQHRTWDLEGSGIEDPHIVTVDLETEMVVRIVDRRYIDSLGNEKVEEYFTDYSFFPNPEGGVYGLGFGTLLRGLNDAASTIINEIIDAGTLANMQGGFYDKKSGIKSTDMSFKRGEYKGVNVFGGNIKDALFHFDFKGPNNTLFATLGLLFEYSKQVSSISETMTGQMPSSDTPATTVLALLEEGRKVFSTIQKRIHRSFKKEANKIFLLNARYLDENIYFKVLDKNNTPEGEALAIGRDDFKDSYGIVPVSNPAIISRAEKIAKAQAIVQDVRTNPLTASDENANRIATKAYYEELDIPNIDELLGPQEPVDVAPEEENSDFIVGKPANVLQKQDHAFHLQVHQEFLQGEFADKLPPQGQQLAGQHIQEHIKALYLEGVELQGQLPQGEVLPEGGGGEGFGEPFSGVGGILNN